MSLMSLSNLTAKRGDCPVVDQVSLTIAPGEFVGLIGPNGAGKTSLMRAALGLLPITGQSSLATLPPEDRAKMAAWMPQDREIAWPMSVETVIALGRLPHLPAGTRLSPDDKAAVEAAITRMGLEAYRNRTVTHLSGGEKARVLIARALAQDTPLLMADEPIAGLDPGSQIATMDVFSTLAREQRGVIASLHDLGLAVRHCTRLILLNRGRLVADGPPRDVLSEENLRQVFGVSAYFRDTEDGAVFQPLEVLS